MDGFFRKLLGGKGGADRGLPDPSGGPDAARSGVRDSEAALAPDSVEGSIGRAALPAGLSSGGAQAFYPGRMTTGSLLANQYRIVGATPLGSGGMGEVWSAEDIELRTPVAIKLLPPLLARDTSAIGALRAEALISRQLTHINICRLYGFHSDGEFKFIVMEFIEGRTLRQVGRERAGRPMPWQELQPIASQIAAALDYAHTVKYTAASGRSVKGVLHRDIKPENIMVRPDGVVKLMDFGIAREIEDTVAHATGHLAMTPLYASPEQYRGEPLSEASDIYSFSAVLYECLAGHSLVAPSGDLEYQILRRPFEPIPAHSGAVNAALAAGLAKDPRRRPATAGDLLAIFAGASRAPLPDVPARAGRATRMDEGGDGQAMQAAVMQPPHAPTIAATSGLQAGAGKLLALLRTTLGPRGRRIVVHGESGPLVTNRGAMVLEMLRLEDPVETLAVDLIRQEAQKTLDSAGGGVTTAAILAAELFRRAASGLAHGADPAALRRGIEKAAWAVSRELGTLSRAVETSRDLAGVVTTVADQDQCIARVIVEAMERVGRDGTIVVEEGKGIQTGVSIAPGTRFDRGFLSPYLVTETSHRLCRLFACRILLYDGKLTSLKPLLPLLEKAAKARCDLLIVAGEVEGDALSTLVVNMLRGVLRVCAVRAPGAGDESAAMLEDVGILTGGRVIRPSGRPKLEDVQIDDLGLARTVLVTKDSTTLIGTKGAAGAIASRVKQIQSQIERSQTDHGREVDTERLAKLTRGIAVIEVGGESEECIREMLTRVEGWLQAVRVALAHGVVAGGGVGLLRAGAALDHLECLGDEKFGVDAVRGTLAEPLLAILENAGHGAGPILDRVKSGTGAFGFNVMTEEYVDLDAAGVMDPTRILQDAVRNAAAVACLLLDQEAKSGEFGPRGGGG